MSGRKKILSVVSAIDRSVNLEYMLGHLDRSRYELSFVLIADREGGILREAEKAGIPVSFIPYRGKMDLPSATLKLARIIKRTKPRILHSQLFEASFISSVATFLARVPVHIHTRHHSTFHHNYHPGTVRYDKFINRRSHHIVAVSGVVKNVLTSGENVHPDRITVIHNGIDPGRFGHIHECDPVLEKKYKLKGLSPRIGVISRFTGWKGIEFTVQAFKDLLKTHPESVILFGNAVGEDAEKIRNLIFTIPARNRKILEFESDVERLYSVFDFFVHVPVDAEAEAFGQVYLEAMAAGKPCIFTPSGIGNEILVNGDNCLLVPYRDSDSIRDAMRQLVSDPALAKRLSENAQKSIHSGFSLSSVLAQLEELYERF